MKVGVWRLGAGFQTEDDSAIGGGRIARRVVLDLHELGHEVTVFGRASIPTSMWLQGLGVDHQPKLLNMRGFGAAVVLTGPFNPLYDALYETYYRLATLEGLAFYAWWDAALPFNFEPERVKFFASKCKVTSRDLMQGKKWMVLTQMSEGHVPEKHRVVPMRRCFWELAEVHNEVPMEPGCEYVPRFAYFGSDRPGRLKELRRWFGGADAPPSDLYGAWNAKRLAEVQGPKLTYRGPVAEGTVRRRLHGYAATLHSADPEYVRTDFVAQRFLENAMAGVPVVYSDQIQPSIKAAIDPRWIVRDSSEMAQWWERLQVPSERLSLAHEHQTRVLDWAEHHPAHPRAVLREVLA